MVESRRTTPQERGRPRDFSHPRRTQADDASSEIRRTRPGYSAGRALQGRLGDGRAGVPLFNLDVARDRTFFVGRHDAQVHDNTPPDPLLEPFDAGPSRAAARRGARNRDRLGPGRSPANLEDRASRSSLARWTNDEAEGSRLRSGSPERTEMRLELIQVELVGQFVIDLTEPDDVGPKLEHLVCSFVLQWIAGAPEADDEVDRGRVFVLDARFEV
jgi:hypothetical protein